MKLPKLTLAMIGGILSILVALTQLLKEVPAVMDAILPSDVPDTVFVVYMGKATGIEVPDSLVKLTARMPITK